jgi:hypothetical protein
MSGDGFDFVGGNQENSGASAPAGTGGDALGKVWGGLKGAFGGAVSDVKRVAGNTADVLKEGAGISNSAPVASAEKAPEQEQRVYRINQAIRERIKSFDAEALAGPYVDGTAQLSRKTRETAVGLGNRELQKVTSGIPVLGDVFRSSGNNAQASSAREAQIAQLVINADKTADRADELRANGKSREADNLMKQALSQADNADRTYQKVFGGDGIEKRHTERALESGVGNAVTRELNKIQPGGLPGFLNKLIP